MFDADPTCRRDLGGLILRPGFIVADVEFAFFAFRRPLYEPFLCGKVGCDSKWLPT